MLSNQQLEYDIDKHNQYWIKGGPWYSIYICKKLDGKVFGNYIRNARTDRHKIMCSIDANEKQQPSSVDDVISSGGNPLTPKTKTEALV